MTEIELIRKAATTRLRDGEVVRVKKKEEKKQYSLNKTIFLGFSNLLLYEI